MLLYYHTPNEKIRLTNRLNCTINELHKVNSVTHSYGLAIFGKKLNSQSKTKTIKKILNDLVANFCELSKKEELALYLTSEDLWERKVNDLIILQEVVSYILGINPKFEICRDSKIDEMLKVSVLDLGSTNKILKIGQFEVLELDYNQTHEERINWLWNKVKDSYLKNSIQKRMNNTSIDYRNFYPGPEGLFHYNPIDVAFSTWVIMFLGTYCEDYIAKDEIQKKMVGIDYRDSSLPFEKKLILKSMNLVENNIYLLRDFFESIGFDEGEYISSIRGMKSQLNMFETLNKRILE